MPTRISAEHLDGIRLVAACGAGPRASRYHGDDDAGVVLDVAKPLRSIAPSGGDDVRDGADIVLHHLQHRAVPATGVAATMREHEEPLSQEPRAGDKLSPRRQHVALVVSGSCDLDGSRDPCLV